MNGEPSGSRNKSDIVLQSMESLRNFLKSVWGYPRIVAEIWTGRFPPSHPREHHLIEKLLMTPLVLSRIFSLGNAKAFFGKSGGHVFMDLYVLLSGAFLTYILFTPSHLGSFGVIVCVYRIADIIFYRLYFMLVKSQAEPWNSDVLRRSLLIVVLNFCETVIGYAVLYLTVGRIVGTTPATQLSLQPIDALYYSMVTAITLGNGDYIPGDTFSRILVITQLCGSVLFLIFLIPALVSLFSDQKPQKS